MSHFRTMKGSPKRAKIGARAGPIWHYVAQDQPLHVVVGGCALSSEGVCILGFRPDLQGTLGKPLPHAQRTHVLKDAEALPFTSFRAFACRAMRARSGGRSRPPRATISRGVGWWGVVPSLPKGCAFLGLGPICRGRSGNPLPRGGGQSPSEALQREAPAAPVSPS